MKKRTRLLMLFLFATLIVAALGVCGKYTSPKYRVNSAYLYWEVFPDESPNLEGYTAPKQASVIVNGTTFTGVFYEKEWVPVFERVLYNYQGEGCEFSVWEDTGELHIWKKEPAQVETCAFNEKQSRELADAIAREIITWDEYQCTEPAYGSHSYHKYDYYKVIDGYKVGDDLSIWFDCAGQMCELSLPENQEAFKNVKSVKIDEKKIQKAVERLLSKGENREFVRYEMRTGYTLMMTAEGQCVVSFGVLPYYKYANGEVSRYRLLSVCVFIDYEKYDWFKL